MVNKNAIAAPSVALPKGGGAIRGIGETFQPDTFTGAAPLSIPIYATPCRGAEPELSLDYSSGAGNSVFGMGFSLSIPNISRKTEAGLPKYDDDDTFIISHAEDLVPQLIEHNGAWQLDQAGGVADDDGATYAVTRYRPRIEGSYARIEKWVRSDTRAAHWHVISAENVRSIYGKSASARICDPQSEQRVFSWLIEEMIDARGNKIVYSYKAEDLAGVAPEIYEINRAQPANTYLRSITYGNYHDAHNQEQWAFEIVFDYGEYNLQTLGQPGSNPYQPAQTWPVRPDPFSSYRAGFEIRTYRLCRNILLFHTLEPLGATPCLVRATQLTYTPAAISGLSQISAVRELGYIRSDDGSYETQQLPPLALTYSAFDTTASSFQPLIVEDGSEIPGYLNTTGYQIVDLYGHGIPGILYADDATTQYWEATGDGHFAPPVVPHALPIEDNLRLSAEYTLVDLNGNGRTDIFVHDDNRAGYYEANADGTWQPFTTFETFPTMYDSAGMEIADMTGDGRSDLVFFEDIYTTVYPSRGTKGYENPIRTLKDTRLPTNFIRSREEVIGFADMFGDGLMHRVRVRNGCVEVWPCLGYGHFGAKITLGNAPFFEPTLDANRLFLIDADGSGTSDLVYVYRDYLELYLNKSGNTFSDPIRIALPTPYDDMVGVNFADIRGNGTASIVLTKIEPDRHLSHTYYDFAGYGKPYLLTGVDTNLGHTIAIEYESSVKYYLDDKRAGAPWNTQLPFPVHVVARTVETDHVSGSSITTLYRYHQGYYDPIERQFVGFGFVERWDADPAKLALAANFEQGGADPLYVAPSYTKTWYHTGANTRADVLSRQYAQTYYQADAGAHELPDSLIDDGGSRLNGEEIREAYFALKGHVLREELYGLHADTPALSRTPYSVTEINYCVRLLQPQSTQPYAVFDIQPQETIVYDYERVAADPRVEHHFTLETDRYGNVTKACTVFYPRRAPAHGSLPAEQTQLQALATFDRWYTNTSDCYLLGLPLEERSFELRGLQPSAGAYMSFDDMKTAFDGAINQAPVLSVRDSLTGTTPQALLLHWNQYFYYDPASGAALPFGQASAQALLHHVAEAAFSPERIAQVFGDRVTDAMLRAPDQPIPAESNAGGYVLSDGYWWNPGLSASYYGPEQFYLLKTTSDFRQAQTTIVYDQYALIPVTHTDPAGNQTQVETVDYRVLEAQKLRDINQNTTEYLFDGFGFVIVSSVYGTLNGASVGDSPLASYRRPPNPTFDDVCQNPATYLQQATTYFFYNAFAWNDHHTPVSTISLAREKHLSDPGGASSPIQVQVTYSDGSARSLQTKLSVDPSVASQRALCGDPPPEGVSALWLTSARVIYNNKGKIAKEYQPCFSTTPDYEDSRFGIATTFFYDPLLRLVRADLPKGFFKKAEISAWSQVFYDEDDTVLDSIYYQTNIANPNLSADEKDALVKASRFYNTPTEIVHDNVGHPRYTIQNNLGQLPSAGFADIVGGTGVSSADLWNVLHSAGYLDDNGAVTRAFQPYRADFTLGLTPPFAQFEAAVIDFLKEARLITYRQVDIEGQELVTIDARLYYANIKNQTQLYNFKTAYDMSGRQLSIDSADAGQRWMLDSALGLPIHQWDSRSLHTQFFYNALELLVRIQVDQDGQNGFWAEQISYGSDPDKNTVERMIEHKDQAGIITIGRYNLAGQALESSRVLCQSYSGAIDWQTPQAVALEDSDHPFTTANVYDALARLTAQTTPDGTLQEYTYYATGWLQQVQVTFPGATPKPFVKGAQYNARGERSRIAYDNGTTTSYSYEQTTERLAQLQTTRARDSKVLQNISYTYDPVGNLTRMTDSSHESVFNNQQQVDPKSDYTYDALYRLTQASGRTHPALSQQDDMRGDFDPNSFASINDQQRLENYTRSYSYDRGGNLYRIQHRATNSWTYTLAISDRANRAVDRAMISALDPLRPGQDPTVPAAVLAPFFDASGNQTQLYGFKNIAWNYHDNLQKVTIIDRGADPSDCEYYVYNSLGQRIRKVTERYGNGTKTATITETIYLGALDITRVRGSDRAVTEERQLLRVMDGEYCAASRLSWTQGQPPSGVNAVQLRYQLDNHQESAAMELDETGAIISYEEFFPFGGTALIAGRSFSETQLKRYRYSGKERDSVTGLYYYGARYYISWLGRWSSPDPARAIDGLNIYAFVMSNPLRYVDEAGLGKRTQKVTGKRKASPVPAHQKAKKIKPQIAKPRTRSKVNLITATYDPITKTAKYSISKAELKKRFVVNNNKQLYLHIKHEFRRKYEQANLAIAAGVVAKTSTASKVKTASPEWIKANFDTSIHGPIPLTKSKRVDVRKSLAVLRPPALKPFKKDGVTPRASTVIDTPLPNLARYLNQDVDEFVARNQGGTTIKSDASVNNQGGLNSFANSAAGSADKGLTMATRGGGKNLPILGYKVEFT